MIEIDTYIRSRHGRFVSIDEVVDRPSNPSYIEGAIELVVNYSTILDLAFWDYVDQLWVYIASMATDLVEKGRGRTSFPDQPVTLEFARIGRGEVLVSVDSANIKRRAATVAEIELLSALQESGLHFFRVASNLAPMNIGAYEMASRQLDGLKNQQI